MQLNKQIITIVLLASLLLSSIGVALYFYKKHKQIQQSKEEIVTVYIAKEDIPKDTLLSIEHLAQTEIAKQFILNTPLVKKEIIGKYTNEKIFKHEIFIKQKLDTQIEVQEKKILDFEKSAYNLKFELFKNPNYALAQGEHINIVSVFPKGKADSRGRFSDFNVGYVANNIPILGFIRDGRYESTTITKQIVKKIINKKVVEELVEVKSDELIVDIDLKVLLNLIKNYNLGTQLWMVKTKVEQKEPVSKAEILKEISNTKAILPRKKIKYQYKMYEPKKMVIVKKGIINYTNDKEGTKSKSKTTNIVIDHTAMCSKITDKFIIGTSNKFYLRDKESLKSKAITVLQRNTIIPYLEKKENWYRTCDDNYIHESVVKEISSDLINSKLGQYE